MVMTKSPNVVVFFTDQQRWDTTGVHGNPMGLTPNFDRMAQEGTHIQHSITCQPVCGPARSCLQTGLYATQTGCYRNAIALPEDSRTIAHCFNEAGYRTGYIGKWHLGAPESHGPVKPEQRGGYDYWLAANTLEHTSDAYDTVVYDNDGQAVKLPGYRVDALTDAAIRYIDRHQDDPFFLFVSYLEPHHQNHRDDYPAPTGYEMQYHGGWLPPDLMMLGGSAPQQLPGYYGMVKRLDEALGRLLDALKSLGLEQDTIVLFTSDHGNHFKTRNGEYKRTCHEASVRVPTAFVGPGFNAGGRVQQLVSLIDLPATLLNAAGLPVPEQMQGRSIMPVLHGDSGDWPSEVFIQISESQVGRAIRTRRWKYAVSAPDKSGWNDPDSEHYVEAFLYDLYADPYELSNLVGCASHQEVRAILRQRLIDQMVAASESAPTIESVPERTKSGQRYVSPQEIESLRQGYE